MAEASADPRVQREIEYYAAVVELHADLVLRESVGWVLLSAGVVTEGTLWAEYERLAT